MIHDLERCNARSVERMFGYTGEMLQGSLFATGPPAVRSEAATERRWLDDESWVDVTRGALDGADDVLDELIWVTQWRSGTRWMYDREVEDPRLHFWHTGRGTEPHPALVEARESLEHRYDVRFGGCALNYYRDGDDSVAPHGDRELRDLSDSIVAVLTLGAQRPFRLRPTGGGPGIDLSPATGDLLVMGGRCQHDWEHGVPKTRRPVGPRVSVSWRWSAGAADPQDDGHVSVRNAE